jgi:DNA-binding transcriptional LysR family regulator
MIREIGMSDIRSLDFNLLMTFDAIYEERSITRAAQRLAVTQPTVSGTLMRLRALFEDRLFVRKQSGMVPTSRADQLAPAIRRLLADSQVLLAPEQFDPKTATFKTQISANDYGEMVVLLPLVKRLRRIAPGIQVAIMPFETAGLGERFQRGQVDIAITIPEMAPPNYPSRFLFSDRYVAVVRSGHAAKADQLDLDTFCAYPHILVSPSGGSFESASDIALRHIGRRRHVAVSAPNFRFILDVAQCDDFIAVLPERMLSKRNLRGLRKMELPVDIKGFDAIIVWHPRFHEDQAHVWLRNQIAQITSAQRSDQSIYR